MGVTNLMLRVPFGAVNLSHDRTYREGWVRHHLLPLQSLRDRALQPFLSSLSDDGFHMDDFRTNGILLPALQSIGKFAGLPVHFGGHPNYNGRTIDELQAIRGICESIRAGSRRREIALSGVRGLQRRLRDAIANQRSEHVDWVVLSGRTDGDLDALIDRLIAQEI
jgi:hypothetical protein